MIAELSPFLCSIYYGCALDQPAPKTNALIAVGSEAIAKFYFVRTIFLVTVDFTLNKARIKINPPTTSQKKIISTKSTRPIQPYVTNSLDDDLTPYREGIISFSTHSVIPVLILRYSAGLLFSFLLFLHISRQIPDSNIIQIEHDIWTTLKLHQCALRFHYLSVFFRF